MQKLSEFFKSGHGLARRAVSKNLKLLKLVLDSRHGVPVWQIAEARGGGCTPNIQMIGMIVVFFRGCNRRFSIF